MRPFECAKITLGLLAMGVALLLASPGVQVTPVLAEELVSTDEPGPQCSAVRPPGTDAAAKALIARLSQERMAETSAGAEGFIVLNGRGYNYGPPPGIELDRILAEGAQTPNR